MSDISIKLANRKLFFGYSLGLILFGFITLNTWGLMLCAWFGMAAWLIYRKRMLPKQLSISAIYLLVIYLYPVLETIIKFAIQYNFIPGTWFWLNRAEHFFWAVAVSVLFLPYWSSIKYKITQLQLNLLIVGLVVILGNFVEFLEFGLRIQWGTINNVRGVIYYWDTIYDLMTNVIGAVVGLYIVTKLTGKNTDTKI
ncbi:MAG: hypothetical protein OHK0017_13850 [Patescibacteria group bacterium]